MAPPEAAMRLGTCDVLLVGTVSGFVPDARRVEAAFAAHRPDALGLGVPSEDVAALQVLAAAPDPSLLIAPHEPEEDPRSRRSAPAGGIPPFSSLTHPAPTPSGLDGADAEEPFAGLDRVTVRLLTLLRRFGPTKVPSPDLEAAFAQATRGGTPVESLDLDDVAHSEAFTRAMKIRHVVRYGRLRRKVLEEDFAGATDAYDLAAAWEAYLNRVRPLAELELAREAEMARRIRELAATRSRLLVVLPSTRLPGVLRLLSSKS